MPENYIDRLNTIASEFHPLKPINHKTLGEFMLVYDDFLDAITRKVEPLSEGSRDPAVVDHLIRFLVDQLFEKVDVPAEPIVQYNMHDIYSKPGWLSPDGVYWPMRGRRLHQQIADDIWEQEYYNEDYEEIAPEEWANVQTALMRKGWLRFDYGNVMFMRRPTRAQYEVLTMMLKWRLENPQAHTVFDFDAYAKIQRLVNWIDGDVANDYSDLEDEIEHG